MLISGIYRLDHMSLRRKLYQFITSAMDTVKYSTRFVFLKDRELAVIESLKTTLTKSLRTYFRER